MAGDLPSCADVVYGDKISVAARRWAGYVRIYEDHWNLCVVQYADNLLVRVNQLFWHKRTEYDALGAFRSQLAHLVPDVAISVKKLYAS